MKFGKEFESQMVPEWKEAYMDYSYLKSLLKAVRCVKHKTRPQATPRQSSLERRPTLYRAFSGLITQRSFGSSASAQEHHQASPSTDTTIDIENQVIVVNSERHETMFLNIGDEGGECEMVFFKKLDEEFNKVVGFYKMKVEEVVKEAEVLNKQMEALVAFRVKVHKPNMSFDSTVEMSRLASDVAASTAALSAATPSATRAKRPVQTDVIDVPGPSDRPSDESGEDKNLKGVKFVNQDGQEHKTNKIKGFRPPPLEILDQVKMRQTNTNPIKQWFRDVESQRELNFSRENLKKVEEQLRRAFIEFHHKLRLLKSFGFLNMLAFSKIMKKYNEITSRNASNKYMKMVDESDLGSSEEVSKLMERVEATFIKHFSNSNRQKGMRILRPKRKKESHRVSFSLGFFVGCAIALIVAIALTIHARELIYHEGAAQYMETMFPLYSLFGFVFLHMLMYAANIYFWRRYRVNYTFILGFKEGTELSFREVFLLSFGFLVLALASVLVNLDLEMDREELNFRPITELVPLGLVVLVVVILICPLNIIYRSSRFFLLTCVFHCICAPLYKVTLPDFFLADQLTSQVQALRSLAFYICYYGWGDYKHRENTCASSDIYNAFFFIVAAIPYWSRLLQCLRRLCEEKNVMDGLNGLKYLSTLVAISVRTAFTLNGRDNWRVIAWIASVSAAILGTYWDIFIDWGLLKKNSKNPWLRDKLLIPHNSVYFVAMVLNVLLRFAWLQTVLDLGVNFLHAQTLLTIVAVLEIIRRGIWNFFRLENEHLNNVGNFRAFKSVPLPFNYDEDGNKEY